MNKLARREMLALGLCTIATGTAQARGTVALPPTAVRRPVHQYANDPTHSTPRSTTPARAIPYVNDPTSPSPAPDTAPARDVTAAWRAQVDRLRSDLALLRRKAVTDMRALVALLVSAEQLKKLDEKLADPTIDSYGFLKSMLEGLIKAKLTV